eukprot:NODE_422_length_8880_cov_0.172759.p5 type:complete len:132 gc:universal NODE_422_length_8880_cov_0.172759:1700-2095(+)
MVFSIFDITALDPKLEREITKLKVSYGKLSKKSKQKKKKKDKYKCGVSFCRGLKIALWVVYIVGNWLLYFYLSDSRLITAILNTVCGILAFIELAILAFVKAKLEPDSELEIQISTLGTRSVKTRLGVKSG